MTDMYQHADQPPLTVRCEAARTDTDLLRQYVQQGSQAAFSTLVQRHGRLVYSTCLREVQDASLAEDAAQVVFLLLARKASSLRHLSSLSGWLFRTARFASRNVLRQERRSRLRDQKAAEEMTHAQQEAAQAAWDRLEPFLNAALASLAPKDQEVVLLRYFEDLDWRETANALMISEDAAQKRCTRALDKMRRFVGSTGLVLSLAALTMLLSEHAAHASPLPAAMLPKLAGAPSPHVTHLFQGVTHTMTLIKAAAVLGSLTVVGTAAGLGWASQVPAPLHSRLYQSTAPRTHTTKMQNANTPPDAKTPQEILAQMRDRYSSLNSFSMLVTHLDDSGLYPGAYTQQLQWQRGGRFELRTTSTHPANPHTAPDFLADGTQVVSVLPDGQRSTDQEAPRYNFMPGWEVTGGFILSWLQNTPNGGLLQSPPPGMTMRWSFGPRTSWQGHKVRELLVLITNQGQSADNSFFVDPTGKSLVGMEVALSPTGKKGHVLYTEQKENMPEPASLGAGF